MKTFLTWLGKRMTSGLVTSLFFAIGIAGITYAFTYNWSDPMSIRNRQAGNPLTSTGWNLLVGNMDNLNERLANAEATIVSQGSTITSQATAIASINTIISTLAPAGAVMSFNLATCPTGWTTADGAGGRPDLRGEFIRGLDNGRGVDSGRTLGSWQKPSLTMGDVLNHSMIVGFLGKGADADRSEYGWEDPTLSSYSSVFPNGGYEYVAATSINYGSIDMHVLGTVRPRNVALLYCVKN